MGSLRDAVHRVDHSRRRERETLEKAVECDPGHGHPTRSAGQPLPPSSDHGVAEFVQRSAVAGNSVVSAVALELATQRLVLNADRVVPMVTTPFGRPLNGSA